MMLRLHLVLIALLISFSPTQLCALATDGQTDAKSKPSQRMTPELLWKLGRLGEAVVSPDGSQVAYTVRHYKLAENKGLSALHVTDLKSGQDTVVLKDWPSLNSIQWSSTPKGVRLFFVGRGGKSQQEAKSNETGPVMHLDSSQAWVLHLNPPGQNGASKSAVFLDLKQATNVEGGIANLKVSPRAKHLAFTVEVKMDKTVNELFEDLPFADARIIDSLMYRHWDAWHDYAYTHLHVAPFDGTGLVSTMTDLMKGIKANCPVPPFAGSEQFNWSPDGKQMAYTLKDVPDWAESTNSDVFVVAIDGNSPAKNITKGMPGYDNDPVYSPDGKFLAFHSMERASFESDRNRIMVMNRANGEMFDATRGLDQTAHGATWTPDSKSLVFASETQGTEQLFQVDLASPGAKQLSKGRYNWGLMEILPNGKQAVVSRMDMLRPKELFVLDLNDANADTVSHINDTIYADLDLPTIEERWVEATDGKKIHCWVIHPPEFEPNSDKKWPLLTYCQGGPQGQIGQWFSYRWNFHLMAANGYVIVAPNRRGLPGFGRAWNDQISGDWGGQAMKDILAATDSMTSEPYIDKEHAAAIGASFGGYTVYWLMGNHRDRFCSMVAHCGVFNLESMYGATEELFFVNYDLGGPYWKSPEIQKEYNEFSPNRFVGKWKTPLLVIHGERDFRVPVTQGMEAFTAAQVQHVESRFLYYPNEGHWVLSPQNGVLWHRVFFEWVDRFCKSSETPQPDTTDK